MPNGHVWKQKLQLPCLSSPAKCSSSLPQFLQALRDGMMLTVNSCLAWARERRRSEDLLGLRSFEDVVVKN